MRRRIILSALLAYLSAAGAPAQGEDAVRLDTPSGYPVPRFLSLKENDTNCRTGPSFEHPIRFVFTQEGTPVLVIAESVDHWRKLRDEEGDECWVHQATLRAQTHVLTTDETVLMKRPRNGARRTGDLAAGVLARLLRRKGEWLLISAGAAKGWVEERSVWGGAIADAVRN